MSIVLATGGLGYIGSHTCIRLIEEGNDVVILDSLINSSIKVLNRIEKVLISSDSNKNKGKIFFREGDIRNINLLEKIFKEFKLLKKPITSVLHFAGLKYVDKSIIRPLEYWDVNVSGTINLLSVMKKYKCKILVFSGSATIYKSVANKKIKETNLLEPINPYGNTKLVIEKILDDLFRSEPLDWRFATLRYFNPVGAHPSGLIGEDAQNQSTNLFPVIMKVINKEIDILSIFGNNWPTKDGTCIRDYIHVIDLAEAHMLALNYLTLNKPQNINLNIGTGKGTSILEIISTFKNTLNLNIKYKFTNKRKGDYPYVVSDNSKAKSILKWEPKKNLTEMCIDSWNWNKKLKSFKN